MTTTPPPPGRDWTLELLAERALDLPVVAVALRVDHLDAAVRLADRVIHEADASCGVAIARAMLARGRALAWKGTEEAVRQADRALGEAAARFAALGRTEWQAYSLFWRGHAVSFLAGDLPSAAERMREALEILPADSERRAQILTFYADTLLALGDLAEADAAARHAEELADGAGDRRAFSYALWTRARITAARGDALSTERLLREVERAAGDWFDGHSGGAFLLDAADLLDALGLEREARGYLSRAAERGPEDDESVLMTRATMTARSGDPLQALDDLQRIARGNWMEKRLIWRHTLLTSWATFRAGRAGAGELAALALEQAARTGGSRVARAGEPELVTALAPLGEASGSAAAREIMLDGRSLLIRLIGSPRVTRADGWELSLPPGQPGELLRMLAVSHHGLPVEYVLEAFFPEAPPASGRHRLRQLLTRLRTTAGDIVVRDGENLRLLPAWVDTREFLSLADRARGARGPLAARLAYAALALAEGPVLPTDPYADWAEEIRTAIDYRRLSLLDDVAANAATNGSHREALTALEAALAQDPDSDHRRAAAERIRRALEASSAATA